MASNDKKKKEEITAFDLDKEKDGQKVLHQGDLSSLIRDKDGRLRLQLATGPSHSSKKELRKFAIKRLMKDLEEVRNNPLAMIAAEPVSESDLFEWHANIVGPPGSAYEDCAFHLIMIIPENYPNAAPRVEIQSYFEHPNVFGKWICLDMLEGQWCPSYDYDNKTQKVRRQSKKDVGYGWTPAYSIQSILVQLQAFLFDLADTTWWGQRSEKYSYSSTVEQARNACKYFICHRDHKFSKKIYHTKGCDHTGKKPWPQPLCWKDRMRFIVPSSELGDVMDTKSMFYKFLERMESLLAGNNWPKIVPLGPGSFFSYTLLPWFQSYDEPAYWEAIAFRLQSKQKHLRAKDGKIIRALIRRALKYLNQKPSPPPMKCIFLQKMYEIESAVDLAVNFTYNNQTLERKRGVWEWYNKDLRTLSNDKNKKDEKKENGNGETDEGTETKQEEENKSNELTDEREDSKQNDDTPKKGEWIQFPVAISDQIEATYLKLLADLRRPNTLVEVLPKKFKTWEECKKARKAAKDKANKENKESKKKGKKPLNIANWDKNSKGLDREFGIITYPRGYYWWFCYKLYDDFTDDEKQTAYQPYSGESKTVRIMKIDPIRTFDNMCLYWMNGPNYRRGRTMFGYPGYKVYHWKYWMYRKKCMILERFRDSLDRWHVNLHPMPDRIHSRSQVYSKDVDVSRIKLAGEGVKYKAYVRGEDDKHYIINVETNSVRCVEDATEFNIRRIEKTYSVTQLWNQITTKAQAGGSDENVDVPWKQPKKEEIKPLPLMDYRKYRGICAFIDIGDSDEDNDDDDDDDSDNDSEGNEGRKERKEDMDDDNMEMEGKEGEMMKNKRKQMKDREKEMAMEMKMEDEMNINDSVTTSAAAAAAATGGAKGVKKPKYRKVNANDKKGNSVTPGNEDMKSETNEMNENENESENNKKKQKVKIEIPQMVSKPKISQRVIGKVVDIEDGGAWVDIGFKSNAYLPYDLILATQSMIDKSLKYYVQRQKDDKERLKEWQKYEKAMELANMDGKDNKKGKRGKKGKKNQTTDGSECVTTAGGNENGDKKKKKKRRKKKGNGTTNEGTSGGAASAKQTGDGNDNKKKQNNNKDKNQNNQAKTDNNSPQKKEKNEKQKQKQKQKQDNTNSNNNKNNNNNKQDKKKGKNKNENEQASNGNTNTNNENNASSGKKRRKRKKGANKANSETGGNNDDNHNDNNNDEIESTTVNETPYDDNNNNTYNNNNNNNNNYSNMYFNEQYERAPQPPRPRRPFSLPKSLHKMSQCPLRIGDIIGITDNDASKSSDYESYLNYYRKTHSNDRSNGLWIEDFNEYTQSVTLTQFKPLSKCKAGQYVTGIVRSIISYAAFIDVGCEHDAFLHKEKIEGGVKNRLLFDCSNENIGIKIGDKIDLHVIKVNSGLSTFEVEMDLRNEKEDHLIMPEDWDESKAVKYSIFGLLSDDLNELIFQYLDRGTLHRCRDVCELFSRIIDDRTGLRWEILELKCFHSKKWFKDCILGFGVNVERYPKSAMICDIDPKLDLLSAESYRDHDVKCNVWKEPFGYFLPVYINKEHGLRATPWIKRAMTEIMTYPIGRQIRDWNPFYVLKIIPALMNTMIVKVMKGELHESIVALEGYTMFYHLMLSFVLEYPKLQRFIENNIIGRFLKTEENRSKKEVSSLGEWIAMLSASDKYTWRDVKIQYLRENFDRHVKWILMQHPTLLDQSANQYDAPKITPKYVRIKKSFNASIVSLKLCMFHVTFLRLFRYSQRSGTVMSIKDTKEMLDRLHGRPTYNMRIQLQKAVKRIKKLKNYKEFFNGIGVKSPNADNLYQWLMLSLENSERRGYHKPWHFLPKKKKTVDKTMGGTFDKFDDMGDAWAAKNMGGSGVVVQEKKETKKSMGDQMISSF